MMWNDIIMWYDAYDENIYKTKIEINVGQALTPKLLKLGLYWILLIFISKYCPQYPPANRYYKNNNSEVKKFVEEK